MSELLDGYYAVPDPDDPAVVTCWRWSARRGLRQWSGGARYGTPTRPSRAVPPRPHTIAVKLAFCDWFGEVLNAVQADPDGARTRFGKLTGCCYVCSKKLTDARSVVLGIGPDCRRRTTP
jgi:hypothetical protein